MAKQKKNPKTKKISIDYVYKRGEKSLFSKRQKRFEKMLKKKKDLGIDDMCDRMDNLYTPHVVGLDDANSSKIQSNNDFLSDSTLTEKARRSMPIAFEKITTAQSLLIKENPKGFLRPAAEKYREASPIVLNAYYENFSIQKKKEVLKKYVYHLGKYGIAYWREYIKKTYRKEHYEYVDDQGKTKTDVKWAYDVFDVVAENIHPKNIILDDKCFSVKDVNRPANDLILKSYLSKEEFDSIYPSDVFENSLYVQEGQSWMLNDDSAGTETDQNTDAKKEIQVLVYENKFENLRETWANCIPMESVPLPGNELDIQGDKWVFDKENYAAIGIGHIIELFQPIIDDIINASNERLRQIVRPNEDWFNGTELADESDDVEFGSGSQRKFTGNPSDVVYNRPPQRTDSERQEMEDIFTNLDLSSMVPRNLSGQATQAKTAYQDAQYKELALQKMNLPLESIKKTIEDAANLDLSLYPICYSEPLQVDILTEGDEDFNEGISILEQAREFNIEDEDRVIVMEEDENGSPVKIARRRFRQFEFPLTKASNTDNNEEESGQQTGRIINKEEREFWEMIPKHFNWKGRIEIIGDSFLPVSKNLEDEKKKETIEFLLNVPITDDMGRPVLKDASGKAFTIDRVKLVKERAKMSKDFDPDTFIVPMDDQNAGQGEFENVNPLETETDLSAANLVDQTSPELSNLKP